MYVNRILQMKNQNIAVLVTDARMVSIIIAAGLITALELRTIKYS
jgi:hypothetical protein